jgi:parallel beta-helix repeat protein
MLTGNLLESTGTDGPGGAVAISIFGPGAYLYQNSAVTTETQAGSTQAIGIRIIGGPGCDVEQNRLVNTVSGQNASYGIQVWSSSDCMVRNNDIDNRTAAKPLDIGVYIIDSKHVQTISNTMTNVARNTVR